MKYLLGIFALFCFFKSEAQLSSRNVAVHDPVLIKQDSIYYLFSTGNGIKVQSSIDLMNWKQEKPVFDQAPAWAVSLISNFKGHIWAPDVSLHNNLYYLYYSVSSFGKNASAIGVATNQTLDPSAPNFKWVDHGKVIESIPRKDHWNAIDPNIITDENGITWMAFGSFWDGIKLVELAKDLIHLGNNRQIFTIASHKKPGESGNNAIEAPFIFRKNGYYYLFASVDYCCKGENSTYKMIVGRSKHIKGPYLDHLNIPLTEGGGTILLAGDKEWNGVGHNAVYHSNGNDYLVFHGYDAHDAGKSKLRITTLIWRNGWPVIKE